MSEFLAEAQVLITPNTAGFRAELIAQLATITKGITVPIPVVAAQANTSAITQSAQQLASAQTAGLAAANKTVAATNALTKAQELNAASARRLAGAEQAASLTTTELAGKRAILREINAAAAISERALAAAVESGNASVVKAQLNITNLVRATQRLAVVDVQTAISEQQLAKSIAARAATQQFAARGAGATALSLGGVRGATLAANSAFLVGAAGAVAFFKSLQLAASMEKELNIFRVTAGATADEMERMGDVARALGRDITIPGVTAIDAAQAMTEFAKAGLSVEDSIDGARGALQLGTAAQLDFISSTQLIANALNAFSLEGEEAVRVADLLTGAANESQASIADMGLALKQSAAVANLAGINVEDTVTILTQLAQAGLSSSDAGTSFRTALIRLIKPTKEVQGALDRLKVELRDVDGAIRPEVFSELGVALDRLSPSARQTTIAMLGGADAIRAFGILANAGATGFERTGDAITKSGLAADQSSARMVGLGGSIENAKNQATDLGLALGNLAKGPVKLLVDAVALNIKFLAFVARETENWTEKTKNFLQPGIDNAKVVFEMTGKTGEYLDRVTEGIPVLDGFFETLDKGTASAEDQVTVFDRLTESVGGVLNALGAGLQAAAEVTQKKIPAAASTLARDIAVVQAQGDQNRELELLRRREENQNAFLQRILERPETKANVKLAEEAAKNLEATRGQIQAILDERVAATNRQAADAEQAAAEAEQAQARADSAFLDALLGKRGRIENLLLRASNTESLKDDIKLTEQFASLIRAQIAQVRKRVKDAQTKTAEIRQLTTLLIQTTNEGKRLAAEQRQVLRDAATERLSQAETGLRLDVELADINDATGRRIALRQKLIQQLLKERRILKLTGNALKENRNEISRINAEIKAILEENKKTKDQTSGPGFAELAFDFLQKQQGFAANLMGNLIPGFATGGLVGGTTADPGAQLQAQAAVKTGTPTYGQMATEVDILKQVLQVLREIQRGRSHPEANYQRATQHSNMDGVGGV